MTVPVCFRWIATGTTTANVYGAGRSTGRSGGCRRSLGSCGCGSLGLSDGRCACGRCRRRRGLSSGGCYSRGWRDRRLINLVGCPNHICRRAAHQDQGIHQQNGHDYRKQFPPFQSFLPRNQVSRGRS